MISYGQKAEQYLFEIMIASGFKNCQIESIDQLDFCQNGVMFASAFQDTQLKVDFWICCNLGNGFKWLPLQLTVMNKKKHENGFEKKKKRIENLGYCIGFLWLEYNQLERATNPHPKATKERRCESRRRILKKVITSLSEIAVENNVLTLEQSFIIEKIHSRINTN